MKLWNARLRDDGDDYQTDEIGTELPTLKGLASSASEGEASESQQHQEQQYRPYPLLTPTKLMRKQSSLDEPQTPIFQVVIDRIEDEVEVHAYDDIVPLEIKLALEDKVFGWTHLTSSVIGHILFTSGAYWLTFQFATITMNHVPIISSSDWAPWIRSFLCLWAAITTFRMVRRRRHVWFRSAYGSKSYLQDAERRRQQVAETDRKTALGRYVQSFKHRRVMSKLRKAETQFAKKHKHQSERLKFRSGAQTKTNDSLSEMSSPQSERQRLLDRRAIDFSYDGDGSSGSDEDSSTEAASLMSGSSSPPAHSPLRKQHRRPSFHTKPTNRMHSIGHDEVLMEEPIRVMPYAHGGFFGAAPFLLSNPHWISLLRHLMPDVYVEISRRVAVNPPSRLIHWAENNPVVAAYGAAHALEQNSSILGLDGSAAPLIPNLEWDVFLDPALVRRVQVVLDQHAEFDRQKSNRSKEQSVVIEAYYKKELRRRSQQLVDKMLIAHGNTLHLGVEQIGVWKDFNYSRVKRTRRTLGGGIYARQWMAVFAEALKLGVSQHDDDSELSSPSKPRGQCKKMSSLSALTESSCPDTNLEESMNLVERITGSKQPLGLVLDIKSRHVPHHIWAVVVDTLRTAGIRVEGVASFFIDEIRDLSRFSTIGPIPSMLFCHSAGDLQKLCHEGKMNNGDKVFFNAGCLLDSNLPFGVSNLLANFDPRIVRDSYSLEACGLPRGHPENLRSCLHDYKDRYNLSIGVYCQEFSIDETAVQTLVKLVNQNPCLYDLGFSWGGVNGITIKGIAPGRFTKTDGYWNQRYIGETWNYDLYPPASPPPSPVSASPASPTASTNLTN